VAGLASAGEGEELPVAAGMSVGLATTGDAVGFNRGAEVIAEVGVVAGAATGAGDGAGGPADDGAAVTGGVASGVCIGTDAAWV
jgi:hypothetical protein